MEQDRSLTASSDEAARVASRFADLLLSDRSEDPLWRALDVGSWREELSSTNGEAKEDEIRRVRWWFQYAWRWRTAFGAATLRAIDCEAVLRDGIVQLLGVDSAGHGVVLVRGHSHQPGKFSLLQLMQAWVWCWEQALAASTSPSRKVLFVFDMDNCRRDQLDLKLYKFLTEIYMNYYPHTLAACHVIGTPWFFPAIWMVFQPWLPATYTGLVSVHMDKKCLRSLLAADQLPPDLGGGDPAHDHAAWADAVLSAARSLGPSTYAISATLALMWSQPSVEKASGSALYSGWLSKKGGFVANFHPRYCVLCTGVLFYYLTETCATPEGLVDLSDCTVVQLSDKPGFRVSSPGQKTAVFRSREKRDRENIIFTWIEQVKLAIQQSV